MPIDDKVTRLHAAALQLLDAPDLLSLFEAMTTGLVRHYGLSRAALVVLDPDHQMRQCAISTPISNADLHFVDHTWSVQPGVPMVPQPRLGPYDPSAHGHAFSGTFGLRSVATIPLCRSNRVIGCLYLGSKDPGGYCLEHPTDFLAYLGAIAAYALENAVSRARLVNEGLTDALTGMPNRRHLEKRLDEVLLTSCRNRSPVCLVLLDVDHFKQVNDSFGHPVGDDVLVSVASRITSTIPTRHLSARYGGEEFAVLLGDTEIEAAHALADQVRREVGDAPIEVAGNHRIPITISAGVASLRPRARDLHTTTLAQEIVRRADDALYRAKLLGRSRVEVALNGEDREWSSPGAFASMLGLPLGRCAP
jgi:diguanylate cyclase (GGDEF)-like protein